MSRGIIFAISLFLVSVFAIASSVTGFAEEEEMKKIEGKVYCVEVDDQGNLVMKDEFTMCGGSLVAIGADGKAYAIKGTSEEAKMIGKQTGETKTVEGIIEGHTRGWVLASASAAQAKPSEGTSVTGTIVCLLPNYQSLDFKQVVATGPCNELEPHLHVVKTKGGQVYALEGTEESIHKIESMSSREDVELQGKIQGEQGAWILFVQ
ncbi:MAG: hypothetical protein HY693_00600 [Deltaproteobacteria bacterium]|nr:hypothetical protein [Deltaproteobacteria bacterium]